MCKKYVINCIVLISSIFSVNANELQHNYKTYEPTKTPFALQPIVEGLNYPWALTFLDTKNLLVTEKNGGLIRINIESGDKKIIQHDIKHIPYLGGHQGGLLDVYFNGDDSFVYFTYSHKSLKNNKLSSSAIARGNLTDNKIINLETLLVAKPPLPAKKHYGSRISIKDKHLFVSFGERDEGMIAQDPSKHPGSIIRIKTNGEIPKDNPKFIDKKNWLPEIYTIGVRNPQGMTVSPHDEKVYFSNHGPRGGDHIGIAEAGANYGWKNIAWGGSEYSFLSIGDKPFKKEYKKPVISWVPSIAVSSIQYYQGNTFPHWNGDLIVCSLNGESLIRLDFQDNKIINEEIIFTDKIGRIRDFEIDKFGDIFLISDSPKSSLWKLTSPNKRIK